MNKKQVQMGMRLTEAGNIPSRTVCGTICTCVYFYLVSIAFFNKIWYTVGRYIYEMPKKENQL